MYIYIHTKYESNRRSFQKNMIFFQKNVKNRPTKNPKTPKMLKNQSKIRGKSRKKKVEKKHFFIEKKCCFYVFMCCFVVLLTPFWDYTNIEISKKLSKFRVRPLH